MSALTLSIIPEAAEVLAGASMPVRVVLTNAGSAPAEVPSTVASYAFQFPVRSEASPSKARVLSVQNALIAARPDPRPMPKMTTSLAPGAKLEYELDLGALAIPPLEPGRYRLFVAYPEGGQSIESPGVPLTIVGPRIGALASAMAADGTTLSLVYTHAATSGEAIVYQQENLVDSAGSPDKGTAYARGRAAPPQAVAAVATAVEPRSARGPRWHSWLQGEALGAAATRDKAQYIAVPPMPVGLRGPVLQTVGWQPTGDSAVFALLGMDSQNRVALAIVTFSIEGKGAVQTVPLGIAGMPSRWAVSYAPADSGRFEVVTAASSAGGTRFQQHSVSTASRTVTQSRVLAERREPIAAIALEPVAADPAPSLDILLGPHGSPPQMTYLRLALAEGPPLAEFSFNVPPETARTAAGWVLGRSAGGEAVLVARMGDQVIGRWLTPTGRGFVLDAKAAGAAHLRLHAVAQAVWAIWSEPGLGLRYGKLPAP